MKICFITDLHIDISVEATLNIDTKDNFSQVLGYLSKRNYDLLVLGGDLCNRAGDSSIYEWIKSKTAEVGIPYYCIAGNHDSATMMAEVFGLVDKLHYDELYYSVTMDGRHLMFLDTSSSDMTDAQFKWLEDNIEINKGPVIIFMHHPPIAAGSKHMEPRYMFKQSEKIRTIFKKYHAKNFHIFCGHYHMERTISCDNFTTYICPSTFIQIDGDSETFRPMNRLIGYREITIGEMGEINSGVFYLNKMVGLP